MKLLVLAVGQRQPDWADSAWADFAKRFPPEMRLALKALKAESRSGGKTAEQCMAAEAQRFEVALGKDAKGARRVVLDERGSRLTSAQLSERMRFWRGDGRDVALLIGGPDGLDPGLKASADETLRLSDLTLPHAFARVLLAEALYRAWSVLEGHPYHRE
jgi:23S rRNA (pseudouridine1915-N3)-methyltransferase